MNRRNFLTKMAAAVFAPVATSLMLRNDPTKEALARAPFDDAPGTWRIVGHGDATWCPIYIDGKYAGKARLQSMTQLGIVPEDGDTPFFVTL